jgi:BirA family biotin operon repressor/biotin-[acetyl-CoA-carboxylase] ligase
LPAASLKWPNDVVVDGAKLAGILVEVLPDSTLVVGIGVNLTSTKKSLPHPSATSLALQGVVVSDLEQEFIQPVVMGLLNHLEMGVTGVAGDVHAKWNMMVSARLSTLGCWVEWQKPDGTTMRGVAEKLAEDGGLVVSGAPGRPDVIVRSGDVFNITPRRIL